MELVTTLPRTGPHTGPLTPAELDPLPDDGRRHELIDGVLVVTPAPVLRHQRAVVRLLRLLTDVCPDDLEVLVAPFDVALTPRDVLQPDLLVARSADLTERDLPGAPLLAVEVLSPSTRRLDLGLKRERYEAAGCPAYWAVDPDEPRLLAWELREGRYERVADVGLEQEWTTATPYAVTVRPADLLR